MKETEVCASKGCGYKATNGGKDLHCYRHSEAASEHGGAIPSVRMKELQRKASGTDANQLRRDING